MRKLAIAMALASTALATPALARDNSLYIGVEGGVLLPEDTRMDYDDADLDIADGVSVGHKLGYDVDLIAGWDFGMFRVEGELGYKRSSLDEIFIDPRITGLSTEGPFDVDGDVTVWSGMINALVDFGDDDGWSGFAGPGIGLASVKYSLDSDDADSELDDSDSGLAWQVVAGVRTALSPNIDVGLKYRFFNRSSVSFDDGVASLDGRFRSHSLLASLVYNFAAPPPPPPPPPEPERG